MARMAVRGGGLGAAPYFEDVPESHPFYSFIQQMKERGITAGCSQNPPRYCPDDAVTRGQLAAFLMRATGDSPTVPGGTGITILGRSINPWYAAGGLLLLLALIRR